MSNISNTAHLSGRLGKNVELITFDDGVVKARFPLATTESFSNAEGEKVTRTQWHDIVAWDDIALELEDLHLGDHVSVRGSITYRTYEDGEGVTRYVTEILADSIYKITRP
jgi:single-strand DNA-binding protein